MMRLSTSQETILIRTLIDKIDSLEDQLEKTEEIQHCYWRFLKNRVSDEILTQFIQFAFEQEEEAKAKEIIAAFHDERMDLSEIECCKHLFKKWEN